MEHTKSCAPHEQQHAPGIQRQPPTAYETLLVLVRHSGRGPRSQNGHLQVGPPQRLLHSGCRLALVPRPRRRRRDRLRRRNRRRARAAARRSVGRRRRAGRRPRVVRRHPDGRRHLGHANRPLCRMDAAIHVAADGNAVVAKKSQLRSAVLVVATILVVASVFVVVDASHLVAALVVVSVFVVVAVFVIVAFAGVGRRHLG